MGEVVTFTAFMCGGCGSAGFFFCIYISWAGSLSRFIYSVEIAVAVTDQSPYVAGRLLPSRVRHAVVYCGGLGNDSW